MQRRAMGLFDGVMHLPCCRPQIGILAHALHTSQHTVGSTCTTATTGLALHRECACVTDQPEASVTEKIWHLAIISNNRIRLHRGATAASATFAARFTTLFTATGHTLLIRSAMTSGQSCGVLGRCVLPRMGASLQRQPKSTHQHVISMRTSRVRDLRQQFQRSAGWQHHALSGHNSTTALASSRAPTSRRQSCRCPTSLCRHGPSASPALQRGHIAGYSNADVFALQQQIDLPRAAYARLVCAAHQHTQRSTHARHCCGTPCAA